MGGLGHFLSESLEIKKATQELKMQQSYNKYYAGVYYGDVSTRKSS